ncbi:membrane protein [Rhizobium sp. NBRC 114257]|uniref:Membrane protein n=2 Tax=Rhizobium/Agrobacterium group TaxID=227290 RepID=A0ABQ0Z7F1_9HYPH|nr:membrane protein [Rhizobium dioscoreae]GLU82699.1 membrane protein [Rhizobium sp. NBRC 114257]
MCLGAKAVAVDFNSELHARPSIYFSGPALVEHIALSGTSPSISDLSHRVVVAEDAIEGPRTQVEFHTEFVTVTRVTPLEADPSTWPAGSLSIDEAARLAGLIDWAFICRLEILICGSAPSELGPLLSSLQFGDTAASTIGGGAALVCSDFRVGDNGISRTILFNHDLNAYRLGRMVRRVYEIETYRVMALLGFPEARRLGPVLGGYDRKLVELTNRHVSTSAEDHKRLLDEISQLSAEVISAAAQTRNRFGATAAYSKIVHVPGFQRFGVFVARRFKPAVRSCEATALRLEQLSHATMHLIDLLQTRIQVEIEVQNAVQIQAMAERAETQVKIQRAVEGLSIIAISYYLLSLIKVAIETADHAGLHINPIYMLISIPVVIGAVALAILRVRHALKS